MGISKSLVNLVRLSCTHSNQLFNMELGYWGIQGLAQPARLLLNYQTTEKFTFKDYTSPDAWQADKAILETPFPNIPYIKTEEHGIIPQSGAVIRFLAEKCNLKGDFSQQIQAEVVDGVLQDLWMAFIKLMFNKDGFDKEKEATHEKLLMFVAQISKQLKKHKFIAGDSVCWVDFKALHFLDVLSKFSSKIAEAEGISDYLKAVVDSGNDDFKAFYEAEKGRRPVFPPFTAWAGGKNMNDMPAEF